MKKNILITIGFILILLAATNPSREDYYNHMANKMSKRGSNERYKSRLKSEIDHKLKYQDYLVCSVVTIEENGVILNAIGIAKNWFEFTSKTEERLAQDLEYIARMKAATLCAVIAKKRMNDENYKIDINQLKKELEFDENTEVRIKNNRIYVNYYGQESSFHIDLDSEDMESSDNIENSDYREDELKALKNAEPMDVRSRLQGN